MTNFASLFDANMFTRCLTHAVTKSNLALLNMLTNLDETLIDRTLAKDHKVFDPLLETPQGVKFICENKALMTGFCTRRLQDTDGY